MNNKQLLETKTGQTVELKGEMFTLNQPSWYANDFYFMSLRPVKFMGKNKIAKFDSEYNLVSIN